MPFDLNNRYIVTMNNGTLIASQTMPKICGAFAMMAIDPHADPPRDERGRAARKKGVVGCAKRTRKEYAPSQIGVLTVRLPIVP